MNYTCNCNEGKDSDAALISEVFAHPVIPYIPEKSSVGRNRSTFNVRCSWTEGYIKGTLQVFEGIKVYPKRKRMTLTRHIANQKICINIWEKRAPRKNTNISKWGKAFINYEKFSKEQHRSIPASPAVHQYHRRTDALRYQRPHPWTAPIAL